MLRMTCMQTHLHILQRAFDVNFKFARHRRDVKALQTIPQIHLKALAEPLAVFHEPAQGAHRRLLRQLLRQRRQFGVIGRQAKERTRLMADPPRAGDRSLRRSLQAQPHSALAVGFQRQRQARHFRGDVQRALLAIRLPGKDTRMIRQRLQEGAQGLAPQ